MGLLTKISRLECCSLQFESRAKFKETLYSRSQLAKVTLFLSSIVVWLCGYCSLGDECDDMGLHACIHVSGIECVCVCVVLEFAFWFAHLQPDLRQIEMIHIRFEDLYFRLLFSLCALQSRLECVNCEQHVCILSENLRHKLQCIRISHNNNDNNNNNRHKSEVA